MRHRTRNGAGRRVSDHVGQFARRWLVALWLPAGGVAAAPAVLPLADCNAGFQSVLVADRDAAAFLPAML